MKSSVSSPNAEAMRLHLSPGDCAKRVLDLFFSLVALVMLLPVFFIIACWIKCEDGGPVFYRGRRVGLRGRFFRIFKFRTMVIDADTVGASSTTEEDPRVTSVGRKLRGSKLDELPQLINVVFGEMSIVGPRPQVPWAVDLYSDEERLLLSVQPGITDAASIRFRNEAEILRGSRDPDGDYLEKIAPEKIRLGLEYVRNRGMWVDLRLIVRTLVVICGFEEGEGFSTITEKWGMRASPEQYSMAYARYKLAGIHSQGKRVLEAGCGVGMGLGYLASRVRRIVAGDYTASNLQLAKAHHGTKVPLVQFDAQRMPFKDGSFDTVIFFEALYYLKSQEQFVAECHRVLDEEGILLLSLPNRNRSGFISSPYSTTYPSALELNLVLRAQWFEPRVLGGYPVSGKGILDPLKSLMRTIALSLGLVPKTLSGRALVKRLIHGKLPVLNGIRDGMAESPELVLISPDVPSERFKNLYVVATRRSTSVPSNIGLS
jgi:lipopolysaccharide/colanic/teichoic acid biosynthesis glycosyltransferase